VILRKLIWPDRVAVVGASTDPRKVGHAILANLVSAPFPGEILAVNPRATELLGRPCYPSLAEVPGEVDLAVLVVPRETVMPTLRACADHSIPAAIVITAGFAETGSEGRRAQREIVQLARQHSIALLGPNCLGLINPWHGLNASFGQAVGEPGHIALISQSGALITAIQDMAFKNRIGFSLLASLGNKAVVDEVDFLHYLQHDANTRVIAAYLEDIANGQEFMRVAERLAKVKPLVVLKSGRTSTGALAASSHTGSLAGSDSAYQSAFQRCGVIRADSIEHLLDVAVAFAYQPIPRGDRVAVITNAGGPGIMLADALEASGLSIPPLEEETAARLSAALPAAAVVRNPVDVLGDADGTRYGTAAEAVLASPAVDALVVLLTPQRMTDAFGTAQALSRLGGKEGKTLLACFLGADSVGEGVALLKANKIPQYWTPERAARALAEMVRFAGYMARPLRVVERFAVNRIPCIKIIKSCLSRGQREIGEAEAMTIIEAYNLDVPPRILAATVEDAVHFAGETGFPLAMKISSPDILHKSDVGGVKVNIHSIQEVEDTFELMTLRVRRARPEAEIRGVLLEKMVPGGREVILGMKRDPQFGPVLMFGLGGIFVEILKDVAFGLAPISEDECQAMLEQTRSYPLLRGVRGERPLDVKSVVQSIQKLSQLVMDFPEIQEVDINPLKVGHEGDGAVVVDARIILSEDNQP
jgi:acetyltransferase